jgi:hypothetical protein
MKQGWTTPALFEGRKGGLYEFFYKFSKSKEELHDTDI